ncbi:MAG TPA: pitrilysin family protein, partial [Luteolibacter sp.]|nr:pitrilysin family protein [Luteolibacter sp.]
FGTLPNGFRYIIYPNTEPPKRVSFRLHVAAGSLMEADDQQGLAHFLEHMVFNGSKHYTSADLIPKMQRLGIAFGAHANAYTSFDETVYMLDLPDLSKDTVDLGFTVMRDFGDGALLEADEIDKERGVILSEKMSRDSVDDRIMEQQFLKILPKSLVAKRFPIGTEEVIKAAPRERFADFYTRYYTPERMTFVVVGDVDPAEISQRIEAEFSSMQNPAAPGKDPDLGPIVAPEGIEPSVFADKEMASTSVSLSLIRPFTKKPDTTANRTDKIPLDLAHSMLSRRFERISKQENSPISDGSASRFDLFNYAEMGSIDVTSANDDWQNAVPVLEQEFRRAQQFGFNDAELAEAKANLLNAYEQAVKQKPTRKSEGLATGLVRTINDGIVFSTPENNLEIVSKALESIDVAKVHEAFKSFWVSAGYHLTLTTKEKPEGAESNLSATYQESFNKPIEAPAAAVAQSFGYTSFGKPGTVTTRKEVADLGITQLVLSNKVRVNLKSTDFEKNRIRIVARIGSGNLSQPANSPMLDAFASAVFEGGGLGKHSNDDLQRILAGKNVSSSLSIGEDAFILSGGTTPADFQLEMQLLAATLTDPGYRTEGLWQFQKAIPPMYQQLKHTTAGPGQEMDAWLHGNDSRYSIAPQEKLTSYTIADAKKWLTPELTKGYLELTIVGDFQIEAIL